MGLRFRKIALLAGLAGTLFASVQAKAEPLSPSLSYGYKTYFQHHPPQDKPVRHNLYPFSGAIIQNGQDIPVCAAAKTAAAYVRKKGIRYIMHGKNGWLFRTADFRTDFTASPTALEYFSRLNWALAARGQTLVIAVQPPRAMMAAQHIDQADKPKEYTPEKAREGYQNFLRQLKNMGIVVADLSDMPDGPAYFPKGDFRWTPDGAGHSAQKISEILQELPIYGSLKKQEFKSEMVGIGTADRGAFEEFIQQTCQVNIELTTEPLWETKPLTAATEIPGIVVLGDSSAAADDKFNFVGALKHFSRTDIHNAALPNSGFGSAAYEYYASDAYHKHPPKIIVWEFAAHHDYNAVETLNDLRQMIPAIYGACSEKTALAQYSAAITGNQTDLFAKIKDKPLKNTYLYLEVTDPKERNLRAEILYKTGDADQVDLTRPPIPGNNGKYYLELGNNGEKSAILFHIITDVPQGHLTARICPYPVHLAGK